MVPICILYNCEYQSNQSHTMYLLGIDDFIELKKAVSEWERLTCIRFKPVSFNEKRKLLITVDPKRRYICASYIGMKQKQPQEIFLDHDCRNVSISNNLVIPGHAHVHVTVAFVNLT